MQKNILILLLLLICVAPRVVGQIDESTNFSVYYSSPQQVVIAGVEIKGVRYLDRDLLIQLSGLTVGKEIYMPGEDFSTAIKKLWGQGLFSDIKIEAVRQEGNRVWIEIYLQEMPRLSDVNYFGVSKSEKDDIEKKVLLLKGSQITENQVNNAQRIIKNIFLEKGFLNADVRIVQRNDTLQTNSVFLDIHVDKKEKVRVQNITVHGNKDVKDFTLEWAMKKTNARRLRNLFRTKKYLEDKYEEDKINLVKKYNEKGYRDAIILNDTVYPADRKNRVNIEMWVEEGNRYYFGDIKWLGNTIYASEDLSNLLGIRKGDIFDQKLLDKRLIEDEDAVLNLAYQNNGYLFSGIHPIESSVNNDSINYDMIVVEGTQATINKVNIKGNTKTHEHVARRELRVYPGDLYSRENIIRSIRELAQLGHFDQESIVPDMVPHQQDGTVDVDFSLTEKANDQIELSGGWGAGMFVGSVGLKFSNFSAQNIFNKSAWRPLPSGDGQTLSLRYQTSGKYYQTVSLSFIEPWLGGTKPNSLSTSFSWSKMNFSANKYMNNYLNSYSYNPYYGYGGYGGYGDYYDPYGYYYDPYSYMQNTTTEKTEDQIWETLAVGIGYGYRLKWPDDFFTVYHEVSFEYYRLKNMENMFYELRDDGKVNGQFMNINFKTVIGRNSLDNPLFTRSGSQFSIGVKFTPPYSLINGKNYEDPKMKNKERYRWIEYHKWNFKGQMFTPLTKNRNLVFRAAVELGFLGYYNKNLNSPFEGFIVGGSGMSGYNYYGSEYISMRGYPDFSLSQHLSSRGGNMYSKYTMELRYPIIMQQSANIYALTFIEAGNAHSNFKNYSPFKLYRSAGVGVRVYLPMFGLMGVDWGYGFDQLPGNAGGRKGEFHFTMGQSF